MGRPISHNRFPNDPQISLRPGGANVGHAMLVGIAERLRIGLAPQPDLFRLPALGSMHRGYDGARPGVKIVAPILDFLVVGQLSSQRRVHCLVSSPPDLFLRIPENVRLQQDRHDRPRRA